MVPQSRHSPHEQPVEAVTRYGYTEDGRPTTAEGPDHALATTCYPDTGDLEACAASSGGGEVSRARLANATAVVVGLAAGAPPPVPPSHGAVVTRLERYDADNLLRHLEDPVGRGVELPAPSVVETLQHSLLEGDEVTGVDVGAACVPGQTLPTLLSLPAPA